MKKYIMNSQGYSLLLAFGVILITAMIGLSLVTITSAGINKNTTREDIVQSKDLADKGTDYLLKELNLFLETYVKPGNRTKTDFENTLLNTIATTGKYGCEQITGADKPGINIPGENASSTNVCIDKVELISNEEKDKYRRLITIKSTGIVNGKEHVNTVKAIVGTDAVPDQLKYAISTNDGGNLYLHGGVEIQGDIKTDGNLVLSNNATWIKGYDPIWQPSVSTKITAGPGTATPKVIFSKENKAVYQLKLFEKYDEHISGNYLSNTNRYKKYDPVTSEGRSAISNLFFNSPPISVITKTSLPQDAIEITNTITGKFNLNTNKANYLENLLITPEYNPTKNFNKTDVLYVSGSEDVCIRYSWYWCQDWEKRNKFGNMTISNSGDKKNITLKGTYFVYGDLTIKNVNLQSDAIIYVQGKVDISNSTIQGIDNNSTLIIFANGNIDIYNMSVDSGKNDASKIKGFFYSKQDMIMYGVGSHINLTGGISARRLILTAVRGDSNDYHYLSANEQQKLDSNGVAAQYSRLKILYDEDLISTYTTFERDKEEEFITKINEPEIIERKQ